MEKEIAHKTEHTLIIPPEADRLRKKYFRITFFVLHVVETLLVFRFFLKAFGANPESGFAYFIYTLTQLFVAPFVGLFPTPTLGDAAWEWYTLVAIIFYIIFAYGILKLIKILIPKNKEETIKENIKIEEKDTEEIPS